jgi:NADH:ubiquinone oxidoreductase subunit C
VTSSPSETETTPHPLQEYADRVAGEVGGTAEIMFDTIKVKVPVEQWTDAHERARDESGLVFFSWLSAIDWAEEVAVGDPPGGDVSDHFELLTTLSDVSEGRRVTFSTEISKTSPSIASLVSVFAGANWHEREAAEMFGIDFVGHPDLSHLYLPDAFIGNPLRKSYPLLSREVKPWPGTVDVEGMPGSQAEPTEPSEENPEA